MKRRRKIKIPKVTKQQVGIGALFAVGVIAVVYAVKGS